MPKSRSLRSLAITTNAPRRNGSPGPPSPTFSESTNVSAMRFGENGPSKIITRADLKTSMQAYENLLNTCTGYQAALLTMSRATAAFAEAMQTCSGLKGPTYEQGTRLQAASGLHHLMGNHWHVLSETLDKNFERPLRQHLDTYRTIVHDRSASYEKALRDKSQTIRETEKRNLGNRKERNLQSFREALVILQRKVDELDELKARHYEEIIEHEEEVWDVVQGKVCLLVRSELDVFDRFTAKSSDPIIEPMLQCVPDPFDSYGHSQSEDQIFSILPPLSIMAHSPSPSPHGSTPLSSTPRAETTDAFATGTTAAWTHSQVIYAEPSSEWADATSPAASPPPAASASASSSSVSPPLTPTPRSASPRRPSSPPSTRRTESKLRSVLAVINEAKRGRSASASSSSAFASAGEMSEETGARDADEGEGEGEGEDEGTDAATVRESGASASWFAFPFAEHPRAATGTSGGGSSTEVTPRSSTFFRTQTPDVPPDRRDPEPVHGASSEAVAVLS